MSDITPDDSPAHEELLNAELNINEDNGSNDTPSSIESEEHGFANNRFDVASLGSIESRGGDNNNAGSEEFDSDDGSQQTQPLNQAFHNGGGSLSRNGSSSDNAIQQVTVIMLVRAIR